MTESLITQHIDLWTSAIEAKSTAGRGSKNKFDLYGIKKLRELILELAVRGKLVPQDPTDEPARALLERIKTEKMQLIKDKKIKQGKLLPEITEDEIPFELPDGWAIVKLGSITTKLTDGSHNPPKDAGSGYPMLSSQNINFGLIDIKSPSRYLNESDFNIENKRTNVESGDILLTIVGTIGRSAVVPMDSPIFALQRSVAVIQTSLLPSYLSSYFSAPTATRFFNENGKGTAQKGIYLGKLSEMIIVVPPIEEQHRIVAKVDELMALCDQLEQQTLTSIDGHATLVETLLETLTNSADTAELEQNWARISEHFDTLFTTEQSIDALKQTILQLAVMGKLVRQDPTDEPASVLLEKIAAEKAQLIKDKKIKKEKPLPPISDDEKPFELPLGWEWVNLHQVITEMDAGWSPACPPESSPNDETWGVLKTTAVQTLEYLENENKVLSSNLSPKPQYEVKMGDILITRAGPKNRVGISCLVEKTRPRLMISDKIIRFHLVNGMGLSERFVSLCLNAGATSAYLELSKSGMAESQMNISQDKLKMAPLPLPPVQEQERIISKLDELIMLCDSLKSPINQLLKTQLYLTDAIIDEVLR